MTRRIDAMVILYLVVLLHYILEMKALVLLIWMVNLLLECIFLNNHSYTSNPVNRGHNFGVINMSGNNAIGMLSTGGQVYNMNTININSEQGGIGIYATAGTDDTPQYFRYWK